MVLNSFTFPFQAITDYRDKFALLERTKETLTRLCASLALSVRKPFNSALSRLPSSPSASDPDRIRSKVLL